MTTEPCAACGHDAEDHPDGRECWFTGEDGMVFCACQRYILGRGDLMGEPDVTVTLEGFVEPESELLVTLVPVEAAAQVTVIATGEEVPRGVRLFAVRFPDADWSDVRGSVG